MKYWLVLQLKEIVQMKERLGRKDRGWSTRRVSREKGDADERDENEEMGGREQKYINITQIFIFNKCKNLKDNYHTKIWIFYVWIF